MAQGITPEVRLARAREAAPMLMKVLVIFAEELGREPTDIKSARLAFRMLATLARATIARIEKGSPL